MSRNIRFVHSFAHTAASQAASEVHAEIKTAVAAYYRHHYQTALTLLARVGSQIDPVPYSAGVVNLNHAGVICRLLHRFDFIHVSRDADVPYHGLWMTAYVLRDDRRGLTYGEHMHTADHVVTGGLMHALGLVDSPY